MHVAASSETGLVRATNQDRYIAWQLGVDSAGRAGEYSFVAVADGMGGGAAGDRASALSLDVISQQLLTTLAARCGQPDLPELDVPQLLTAAAVAANSRVLEEARLDPALEGMGTTLTAALVSRGVLYLAQVGDSRCYRIRHDVIEQLTTDHSVVSELVRAGKLAPARARSHPRRNIITRAIGASDELKVDTCCHAVEVGDVFLLCSDGLWELVTDERILEIVSDVQLEDAITTTDWACKQLITAALERGGEDNITVVLGVAGPADVHPNALREAQAHARTRVETASAAGDELKKTLRFALREVQL